MKYLKALTVFLVALGISILLYNMSYSLDFERVYECEEPNKSIFMEGISWCTVTDEKYQQFFSMDEIKKSINYDFDTENYSYIVCHNHQLKKMTFKISNPKKRKFIVFPYEIVGNALLDKETDNKIYVYRIRKMNITIDYHNPDSCAFYQ